VCKIPGKVSRGDREQKQTKRGTMKVLVHLVSTEKIRIKNRGGARREKGGRCLEEEKHLCNLLSLKAARQEMGDN